jgi:hypothetical protein
MARLRVTEKKASEHPAAGRTTMTPIADPPKDKGAKKRPKRRQTGW